MKYLLPSAVLYLAVAQWSIAPLSLPTGALIFSTTVNSCPLGTSEATDIAGKTLFTVSIASSNAGNTGGSDSITPTGTNSTPTFTGNSVASSATSAGTPAGSNSTPTFTGDQLATHSHTGGTYTAAAQVFTGSPLSTHTHTYTDVVNHTHTVSYSDVASATTGGATTHYQILTKTTDTSSTASDFVPTSSNPSGGVATGTTAATSGGTPTGTNGTSSVSGSSQAITAGTPSGSVSAPTFTGSALGTHTHTTTATGSISTPTFTGNSFDNRSSFVSVVACRVN